MPTDHPPERSAPMRYDEIAAHLVERIGKGDFPPNARRYRKLPSYRELADEYDVDPSTIARAIKLLRDDDVLVGRPGDGVYVADRKQPEQG